MTGFLLDTNVVSDGAPTKAAEDHRLRRWVADGSREHLLSVVTLAELADGVAQLNRSHRGRRALALRVWFDDLRAVDGGRILRVDADTARMAGDLVDLARSKGHAPGLADALIASTASRHGLTLVALNVRHFHPFGVDLLDPRSSDP